MKEYYTRNNIYAKVGSVVNEYAGWFEMEPVFGETYEIILSESALDRMFPGTEYSRADIYTNSASDYDTLREKIDSYIDSHTNIHCDDRWAALQDYRAVKAALLVYTVLVSVMAIAMIFINIKFVLSFRRHYIQVELCETWRAIPVSFS